MKTRTRGTGRIFQRKGSAFLWCAYYLRGKEFRESTGETDLLRAEKFLKHRIKEVGADQIGKAPFIGPQQEHMKVSKLLDALEADFKLRGKDSPQFRSHLKHIREYFGGWHVLEVTAEAVDTYIAKRQNEGAKPATINRSTDVLAQAFKRAIQRKHLSTAPQIRNLSEKGNARQGFFHGAGFNALVVNLPLYLQDFSRFGYLTGWRKGEISSLQWKDMDDDLMWLLGRNAKNRESRIVPMCGELEEIIERCRAQRQVKTDEGTMLSAYVFHNQGRPIGDFRRGWATAAVAAGLGHFFCPSCKQLLNGHFCSQCCKNAKYSGPIFHDLRRTAVRNMVRAGVPEKVAMAISGHKTRAIFDRYNIVNEDDLRDAMQRTQDYLKKRAQQPKRLAVMRLAEGQK